MGLVKGLVAVGMMLVNVPVTAGADCKVNAAALVAHVKITLAPEGVIVSCGALTAPNERLNTVPLPELPPLLAVPYRVLPDKTNPADGVAPSLLVVKVMGSNSVKL